MTMATATIPKDVAGQSGRRRGAEGGPPPPPPPVAARGLPEGSTPLMYACQQGRDHEVRKILAEKPGCASDRDRTLKTALHYCAENASPACAAALLSACPSLLDASDEEGYTAVHLAVISGNRALLRLLIDKGANVIRMDREGHSAVHWATVCGEVEALEMVIAAGANPSTPDIHGGYPVHYAAQMCGSTSSSSSVDPRVGLAVLRRLLAHKVKVDVTDKDGRQPILWAASAGSADAIIALVHAGAGVEAHDKDGLTALHCAASRGHTDCLETLVTLCGSEVDVIDGNGCTALFYAATLGHADSTRLLLGFGAQPNRQDRKGRTAAHCGAAKGQLETLRLLSDVGGADLWIRNVRGDLPLHEAVQSGRRDLVRWLLQQRSAAVNAANNDGRCPLHVAAIHNNVEMCKVLLDSHSLVNPVMRTPRGQMATPLDTALLRGNRGCAKFLQLHGGVPASKLTEESARLHGGGVGGVDGGSPADLYLDTAVPISEREADSLGNVPPLPIGQQTRTSQDLPSATPTDGFRSDTYGGSLSRGTLYQDGPATTYRTTEDKFIQVNDDIAIQYVERIRLSENDGDQEEEELQEVSLLRGKVVSHRRLRGGDQEEAAIVVLPRVGGRSREDGGVAEEEEGSRGGSRGRRGEKSRGGRRKGWGEECIREEEEEESEEEEEESMRRKKKSRRKRTTRKTKKKEEESEEEGEGAEDEEVEEVSGAESEKYEELERETEYGGKRKKGGRKKTVKTKEEEKKKKNKEEDEKSADRKTRIDGIGTVDGGASSRKITHQKTKKKVLSSSSGGQQSTTSPEKGSDKESRHRATKIPVRKRAPSSNDRKKVSSSEEGKKADANNKKKKKIVVPMQRSSSSEKKKAVEEIAVERKTVKGERSAKASVAVGKRKAALEEEESVRKEAEGKSGTPSTSRNLGDGEEEERRGATEGAEEIEGAEEEQEASESVDEEGSPLKGTVQGKIQEVVAVVHKEDVTEDGSHHTTEVEGDEEEEDKVVEKKEIEDGKEDIINVEDEKEEIGDEREEIGDERKEIRDEREEIGDEREEIGDEREEIGDEREEIEDEKREDKDEETEEKDEEKRHEIKVEGDKKEEDGVIEEEKVKEEVEEEGGEVDEGVVVEGPSEREEERPKEERVEVDGEGKQEEEEGPKTREEVTEDSKDDNGAGNVKEGSAEAARQRKKQKKVTGSEAKEETDGERLERDEDPQSTSEMEEEEEETARADDIDAKKMAAKEGDKMAGEADDTAKDRTEDDVSQLAEDLSSINEATEGRESPSKDEGICTFEITGVNRTESKDEGEFLDSVSLADGGVSTAEADVSIETIVAAGDRKESEDTTEHVEDERGEEMGKEPTGDDPNQSDVEGREEEERRLRESDGISQREEEKMGSSMDSSSFVPILPLDKDTPSSSSRVAEETECGAEEERVGRGKGKKAGSQKEGVGRSKGRGGSEGRVSGERHRQERIGVRVEIGEKEEVKEGGVVGGGRERRGKEMPTTSMTQAVQNTVRKYHLERHIFSELLELKRLQIRAGRANENVLVKRLVDNFHGPAGSDLTVGIKRYDGHYTFRSFEKYLYDQLRQLQSADPCLIPKIKSTDDMEKISSALKRTRATTAASSIPPSNPALCTQVTYRCHHAAHAYTGIPCAAYITKGGHHHHDHHLQPRNQHHSLPSQRTTAPRSTPVSSFLPKIETVQDLPSVGSSHRSQRFLDPSRPVTLELSHGSDKRQVISLPTQRIDQPKRYLVTFTIKPGSGTTEGVTITTKEGQVKVGPIKGEKASPPLSESPESDPTSFRHRHAKSL